MKKTIFAVVLICYVSVAEGSIIFDDGQIHNITWHTISDTVIVRDDDFFGLATTVNVLDDGKINGALLAYENSIVTVSGGLIGGIIKAGIWPTICSTKITFKGTNFAINGHSVNYGTFDTEGQDYVHGTITGTLANGDLLNNEFYINGSSSIVLIPEPATLLLLGLGAVVVRKKVN